MLTYKDYARLRLICLFIIYFTCICFKKEQDENIYRAQQTCSDDKCLKNIWQAYALCN